MTPIELPQQTREGLIEIAMQHADSMGQPLDELEEDLGTLRTHEIREILQDLGYDTYRFA